MRHEFEVILGLVLLFLIFILLGMWLTIAGVFFPVMNNAVNTTSAIQHPSQVIGLYTNIQIIAGAIFLMAGIGTLVAIIFLAFSNQPTEYEEQYYNQYNNRGGLI